MSVPTRVSSRIAPSLPTFSRDDAAQTDLCIFMSNYGHSMKRVEKGKAFIQDDELSWEQADVGIRRKILSYDDALMMVKVAFEKGGIGALHRHPHVQISYVESGLFEVTIGDEVKSLKQGDAYYIAPNVLHGAVCLEEGVLIDVFTPKRDDFL